MPKRQMKNNPQVLNPISFTKNLVKFMKFSSSAIGCFLLVSCAAADKRLYGDPSLSVAIYSNQTLHATQMCASDNSFVNQVDANRFLEYMNRTLNPKYYIDNYEQFAIDYKQINSKFTEQLGKMSNVEKQNYCSSFSKDIEIMGKVGIRHTIQRHIDFRTHFSPSHQARENLRMLGAAVILLAQAVPTAKGISQTNKGNYNDAGKSFASSQRVATAIGSVSNSYAGSNCESFMNFANINKSKIEFSWNKYISILECSE